MTKAITSLIITIALTAGFTQITRALHLQGIPLGEAIAMTSFIGLVLFALIAVFNGYLRATPGETEPEVFDTYSDTYKKKEETKPPLYCESTFPYEYTPSPKAFNHVRLYSMDKEVFVEKKFQSYQNGLDIKTKSAMLKQLNAKVKKLKPKFTIEDDGRIKYEDLIAITGGKKKKTILTI